MIYSIKQLTDFPFQFYGYQVDAKRGLLRNNKQDINLEPKVMLVLLYLIAHAENVVDQEDLFSYVWPNSVFTPNSLRRCISSLRSAFNDHEKSLIATHPKLGYSINGQPDFIKDKPNFFSVFGRSKYFWVPSIFILLILLLLSHDTDEHNLSLAEITPVTATEILEDFVAISPDNSYLAFTRFQTGKIGSSHIWLKQIATGKEKVLEVPSAHFRNLNWTQNGRAILFVEMGNQGWQIRQASLNQNFDVIKVETILKDNNKAWISSVHMAKNENVYFISNHQGRSQLYSFNLATKNLESIFLNLSDFFPYELALNSLQNTLAIVGQGKDQRTFIQVLNTEKNMIEKTLQLPVNERFSIDWLEGESRFLLNNGRRLYSLDSTNKLEQLTFGNTQFVRSAKSAGGDIYFVDANTDNDIQVLDSSLTQVTSLINSNAMDYFPVISHRNQKIAFYSTRYGRPQLFLHDIQTGQDTLLFDNPVAYLSAVKASWSQSDKQLAFTMGENLFTILFESGQQYLTHHKGIEGKIVGWYPDEDSLLLKKSAVAGDQLFKYERLGRQQRLIADIGKAIPILSPSAKIYLVDNLSISQLRDANVERVTEFKQNIVDVLPSYQGLYLNFDNQTDHWSFWSYQTENLIPEKVIKSDYKIITISSDGLMKLTQTERKQNDIVKLSLD